MNFKTPLKLSSKQKLFSLPLILIIALVLSSYFLIFPSITEIKKIRTKILNQKIELKNNIEQSKNINKLNEELKNIKPKIESLNQIFINKNRRLDFITLIESIADQYKLEQKINLNPGQEDAEKMYKTSPIRLNLRGSYLNIIKYLREIESIKYYININSIKIIPEEKQRNNILSEENDTEKNISAIIGADIYWKNN